MKKTTLSLVVKDKKVLLAMKKRGFGQGRWNGSGGKFDEQKGDKSILDTAIRETKEEIGIELKAPTQVGVFRFKFPHKPEWDQEVAVFLAKDFHGEIKESEEMLPQWFGLKEIPYDQMWDDDKHWLPHILAGRKLDADFTFKEGDKIEKFKIKFV